MEESAKSSFSMEIDTSMAALGFSVKSWLALQLLPFARVISSQQ
jgi:hypothetical protein